MRSFKIKVAGKIVRINAMFTRVYKICQDFLAEGEPILSIECSMQDFDRSAERFERQNNKPAPSDVYLEEFSVLEKLADAFIDFDTLAIHGAAVCLDNEAFLFSGHSGIGKTTHALKWIENCPNAFILNGDKPFIIVSNDKQPVICGSPWKGNEEFGTTDIAPLKAIVFLERSENNYIYKVSFSEIFTSLYAQIYRSNNAEKMRRTLKILQMLDGKVSFYRFEVNNFKDDCFAVAYNGLVGHNS